MGHNSSTRCNVKPSKTGEGILSLWDQGYREFPVIIFEQSTLAFERFMRKTNRLLDINQSTSQREAWLLLRRYVPQDSRLDQRFGQGCVRIAHSDD